MAEDDGIARRPTGDERWRPPLARTRRSERTRAQAPARDVDYHRGAHGQQMICYTCNCRPCTDRCTEQWMPDTLHLRASRANLTVEQWAEAHPDWIGWTLHAKREDVATVVASLANAERLPPNADARRIPVGAAMEQAMAVMAGQVQAEDVAPVYDEAPRR